MHDNDAWTWVWKQSQCMRSAYTIVVEKCRKWGMTSAEEKLIDLLNVSISADSYAISAILVIFDNR